MTNGTDDYTHHESVLRRRTPLASAVPVTPPRHVIRYDSSACLDDEHRARLRALQRELMVMTEWVNSGDQTAENIADVQSSADTRRIPINQVGIKDIRHPIRVKDRGVGEQHTIATFNMYVNLPHNVKGTHMSRFVAILNQREREIGVESFREMLVNDRNIGSR